MRELPEIIERLCKTVDAPPRLVAHLTLVHDVAVCLVEELQSKFPDLPLDTQEICFGAGTHDIGKVMYRAELSSPGNAHEAAGENLLLGLGIEPNLARFARTHAAWRTDDSLPLEDLLVSLADSCWKGKRAAELENLIANRIAGKIGKEVWDVFMILDNILQELSEKADERLAWQAQFPA